MASTLLFNPPKGGTAGSSSREASLEAYDMDESVGQMGMRGTEGEAKAEAQA